MTSKYPRTSAFVLERFYRTVNETTPDACWEWSGLLNTSGYGLFRHTIDGKPVQIPAHRFMYILVTAAPIPDEVGVCHTCDNRRCCNPAHLYLGTQADNVRDMMERGRQSNGFTPQATHCRRGHEYTPENTRRSPYSRGRICVTCATARWTADARKNGAARKARMRARRSPSAGGGE